MRLLTHIVTILCVLGASSRGQQLPTELIGPTVWSNASSGISSQVHSANPPLFTDVTGDGISDLVVFGLPARITTFPGVSGGGFGAPVSSLTPQSFSLMGPAFDYDLDGNVDLVGWGNNGPGGAAGTCTLLGDGTGRFTPTGCIGATFSFNGPLCMDVGDLDADGVPELVTHVSTGGANREYRVYRSLAGGWVLDWSLMTTLPHCTLRIGDVTGDNLPDIIVYPLATVTQMYVLRNDGVTGGNLSFTLQGPFAHGFVSYPCVADLNGDGTDDAVSFLGGATPQINVCLGDPVSTLLPPVTTAVNLWPGGFPNSIGPYTSLLEPQLANLNGDELLDLHVFALQPLTNPTGSVVLKSWVFFADGPASFSTDALVIDHGTATPLGWVRIEDIDADGDGDMLLIRDRADLPAAPTEIGIAENRAITGAGMMGSQGIPMMRVGTPVRGNAAFTVALTNAAPLSSVILGASRSQSQTFVTGQAGLWLNLAPSELIWPTTSFGIFSTDANGQLVVPLPIPVSVSRGEGVYGQCAVLDAAGVFTGFPFGAISLSNAVHVLIW